MKARDTISEYIASVAIALFLATLAGIWLVLMFDGFREFELRHQRSVESRADRNYP